MQEKIRDFLTFLTVEKNYSQNTIAAYRNDLSQFITFLRERMPSVTAWIEVSKEIILSFVLYLKEREYTSSTVARKVAAIKSFFHYLVASDYLKDDPTATLDSPRVSKHLPKAISPEDIGRLLAAPAERSTPKALRDKALLEVLYATGMRVSELVSLNVDDVNLASNNVRCLGRGAKERIIPIYEEVAEALQTYLNRGRIQLLRDPNEGALFLNLRGQRLTRQGLWLIIKLYAEQVGITSDVTPHTLRHSFATHMLNDGVGLQEVQKLLGHANISTTQVYTQVRGERRREVHNESHSEGE
ncbi:MAG: site-specific tyrosine recombinase XerD [Anaerolineae bacterium]